MTTTAGQTAELVGKLPGSRREAALEPGASSSRRQQASRRPDRLVRIVRAVAAVVVADATSGEAQDHPWMPSYSAGCMLTWPAHELERDHEEQLVSAARTVLANLEGMPA